MLGEDWWAKYQQANKKKKKSPVSKNFRAAVINFKRDLKKIQKQQKNKEFLEILKAEKNTKFKKTIKICN